MARTLLSPLVAYGPASGAVSQPVPLDSTNGNMIACDTPFAPQNIDKFGVFAVISNTGTTGNAIIRNGVANGGTGPDLVTSVASGAVAVIGPLPLVRYGNPLGDGHQGLWIDFGASSFAGTIMLVCGLQQFIPSGAQVAAIKMSPGTLLGAVVTTLGTAAWNAYDDAMAVNGAAIATFAGSAAVGSMTAPNRPTVRGIVSSSLASGPVLTCFFA